MEGRLRAEVGLVQPLSPLRTGLWVGMNLIDPKLECDRKRLFKNSESQSILSTAFFTLQMPGASPSLRGGLGGPWPPPWGKFLYGGKGGPLQKGVILGNLGGSAPPMEICQRRAWPGEQAKVPLFLHTARENWQAVFTSPDLRQRGTEKDGERVLAL